MENCGWDKNFMTNVSYYKLCGNLGCEVDELVVWTIKSKDSLCLHATLVRADLHGYSFVKSTRIGLFL